MTAWLRIETGGSFRAASQRINLDTMPVLTINTGAISCGNQQSHYWIENDGAARVSERKLKPPYAIPSMVEIAALPWNGFTVASTFAGGGGSSTGYRMAGFEVVWANELTASARASYAANMDPATHLDGRDIRKVQADDILKATSLGVGELDIFDGSPPCVSFSTAGKLAKGWGKVTTSHDATQRQDDLFFEYARLLKGLQPRVFVAENVSGLIKGVAKGYFLQILATLKACGYRVEARLLDAQWLGVPQMRQRLIFIGTRLDLDARPAFPAPLGYRYSVRDALSWISGMESGHGFHKHAMEPAGKPAPVILAGRAVRVQVGGIRQSGYQANKLTSGDQPSPTIMAGGGGGMNTSQFGISIGTYQGGARSINEPAPTVLTHGRRRGRAEMTLALPPSRARAYDGQQAYSMTIARSDKPTATITTHSEDHGHPTERRKFTIAELRRICAFPDDYELRGSYADQWARCGNAVPPVMMRAIAEVIRDRILIPLDQKAAA